MADGLRRSTRVRTTWVPLEEAPQPVVNSRKRKRQEVLPEPIDLPAAIKHEVNSSDSTHSEQATSIKVEIAAPIKKEPEISHEAQAVKTELPDLAETDLRAIPEALEAATKSELAEYRDVGPPDIDDHDFIPVKPVRKPAKKSRAIQDDTDSGSMIEKPKRKTAKKKKAKSNEPHRLVVTDGMLRPKGERRPPMIYPVIKKPRDPKLPSLLSEMVSNFSASIKRARAKIPRLAPGQEEARLLPSNNEPTESYQEILDRAQTQRLFVLQRERGVEEDCHAHHPDCPIEDFLVAGTTGNVYTVTITHKPTCSCGDYIFRKRNCKHILYVLHNVLKVTNHLKHQNAFMTSELREIAQHAPPMPEAVVKEEDKDGKRKPIEDDCPICCMAFETGEDIIWCQAACGNNVHKQCFQKWAEARLHHVTCPFCRSEWRNDAVKAQTMTYTTVAMPTHRNNNGYLNVADQLARYNG